MIKDLVLVDFQQIFYYVKRQKRRIDFKKFFDFLLDGRSTSEVDIVAFLTVSNQTESSYLISTLQEVGFEINALSTNLDKNQLKYSSRSISIAIHALEDIDKYNGITLVTINPEMHVLKQALEGYDKTPQLVTFKEFKENFESSNSKDNLKFITEDYYVSKKWVKNLNK